MLPSPSGCWLDPRGYSFSRPQCVHCYYSPVTRNLPSEDLVDRLRKFCFHPLRYPNYGALTFSPAGLPPAEHASLTWTHIRTCEFRASGSSRERFACSGVAVEDLDWRQWVPGQKFVEAGPWDHASTMTPRQPLAPDPNHLPGEPAQAPTVAANTVIGEVAPHHRRQVTMLVADRPVAVVPAPVINRGHRTGKPALGRHLPNHILAVPGPPPDMGKPKEVEAGSIRLRMSRVLWSLWAEVDEARLVGMESKSISCKPLVQHQQHAFGIDNVVERH